MCEYAESSPGFLGVKPTSPINRKPLNNRKTSPISRISLKYIKPAYHNANPTICNFQRYANCSHETNRNLAAGNIKNERERTTLNSYSCKRIFYSHTPYANHLHTAPPPNTAASPARTTRSTNFTLGTFDRSTRTYADAPESTEVPRARHEKQSVDGEEAFSEGLLKAFSIQ